MKKQPQHPERTNETKKTVNEPAKTNYSPLIPHVVAILIFLLITSLYFSPMFFGGKVISQSDIIQYKGVSKEMHDYEAKTGEQTLWTNSMFGGMPTIQIGIEYRGNLLQYLEQVLTLFLPHPARLLFLAFLTFYFLLVSLRVDPWLSIAGAIAFTLGSYNLSILQAGHNSKMHAIALIPLAVAGVIMIRNKKYIIGSILTAVALSLQLYANHLQITYYLMLLLLIYGIVELIYAIRNNDLKNILILGGIIAVCTGFAVLNNLSLLWSTSEYIGSTIRGASELSSDKKSNGGLDEDYAFQWSYGKLETMTLLIPNFYGGSSSGSASSTSNFAKFLGDQNVPPAQMNQYLSNVPYYWGSQPFTSGPFYVGAIICFLFVFGLLMVKDRWRWWLLTVSVIAILLSWGKNLFWFSDLFFQYMPGYNRFRTVQMILVLLQFTFPFLGFLLLSKIVNGEFDKKELIKNLKISVYITGGLCLFFGLFGGAFLDFTGPNDKEYQQSLETALVADRESLLRLDAFRSLIFILLAAALIWLFAEKRVQKNLFLGGMIVLIFLDLFTVGKRYLNDDNFIPKSQYDNYYRPSQADQLILKDPDPDYRVLNLATDAWNDASTSYFHKSIGGYCAAKLRRYQDLIENQLSKVDSVHKKTIPPNESVLDMLNTKYIIYPVKNAQQVFPNAAACGNVWFVDTLKWVDNADQEMSALDQFNPKTTAIVDKAFSSQLQGFTPSHDSSSVISLQKYEPNDLTYQSKSSRDEVAVFSEIYYQPGWEVSVDGKKADHFRCDYVLRGMKIPAGNHTIEFKFQPESFYTGESVAKASSGLLILLSIGGILFYMRRKKEGKVI